MNEFERIAKFFAPLAAGAKGAFGLTDDAAVIAPPPGEMLVVTQDTLVESIHFIGNESPVQIAQKALRVNLSDLAAKGARPFGYFLSLSLPPRCDETWIPGFCEGLAADQQHYGITLMGGDSTSSPDRYGPPNDPT
jgi:thiamine-monophosphate kinase